MKTLSSCYLKLVGPFLIGAFLSIGLFYSSMTFAAQGCGFGYHMTVYGRCVPNSPGPWATPVRGRPDCWVNERGFLRCWR